MGNNKNQGIMLNNEFRKPDFTKTGAIDLIDQKISDQQQECAGRYIKIEDYYKCINRWLIGFFSTFIILFTALVGWSYRPLGEIRELSISYKLMQKDISYIKEHVKK